MPRGFVLCADDFALTRGVSRSILALLEAGKLSAAGAMTNRPYWKPFAREFMGHRERADLGLHLNLTCAAPLAKMPRLAPAGELPPLSTVARGAFTSAAVRGEIKQEIARQLDAFEDAAGAPPAFLDGHQHVHVLPGVRGAVLDALMTRYPAGSVYLRDPADSARAIRARGVGTGKALVIANLARGLRRSAGRRGIPVNRGFSGVSTFDASRDFDADLARFLIAPGSAHLVMCHPGFIDDELVTLDPVVATRPIEHAALMSFAPPQGLPMVRFSALGQVDPKISR
jgi:predicted glycoside hydrolase/deacetylase ChbG (UPF0249 family)